MQIYRAEDGEVFQVNKTLKDIEKLGTLEQFLHEVTGVEEVAVLAYLSDGRRLRDENLRELAGAADQSIFVFNKHYLDYDLDDILLKLRADPHLQPEIGSGSSSNVDTLANTAISHYDSIGHIFNTIHVQHDALRIASTSLDLNVLSISDAFEGFAGGARRELEKQTHLLQGLDLDLEVIGKIRIHSEFLSPSVRKAVEAGEKARTLGDYVSNVKMRQVGDACAKTHNELRGRFSAADDSMNRLTSGADEVRSSVVNFGFVEEAELCMKRSQEVLERTTEIRAQLQEPRIDQAELLTELRNYDVVLRDEVQLIADIKNKSTALCMRALRHISHLNNDLMLLPQMLSSLQSDFRAKTNFAHIQRLHNMLYAYGATLVEIVRRKEFCASLVTLDDVAQLTTGLARFFTQRAQTIAEIMAKLSSTERKRRQIYRGDVHGQLPFDAKGMDDSVPAIEITSTGVSNSSYSIEREDLMALLSEVDKIDQSHFAGDYNGGSKYNPLGETRSALEKLINRMDNLEAAFDKMAEKTIFSASRVALPRRQATDHTNNEFQEVVEQLHELQDARGEQERQFMEDRHLLENEIEQLHLKLRDAHEQASHEKLRAMQLEEELRHEKAQSENEVLSRRTLEDGEARLRVEMEDKRKALADALVDLAEQARLSDTLRQELADTRGDFKLAKRLEMEASGQVMLLLSEKELLLRSLEGASTREKELESRILTIRQEVNELNRELSEALEEKDRRLKAQALEADRMLRDVIAEADGDRAVLEHQGFEMRGVVEATERQLKASKAELDILNADVVGLREELQRTEHELQDARVLEGTLRNSLQTAESVAAEYKARLEASVSTAKDLLHIATAFRDSHCKAFAAAQASSSSSRSLANLADSMPLLKHYAEPAPVDLEDLAGAAQILSEYDFTSFNDTIVKMGSTVRKWQKQCKEYRDRAKGKISFRNFAKGDLALFLPTRNSISKPWAAFNVSFPHYFLQATGNLAEQLKTREWIVARITSIREQVAAIRDPSTNPYGLGDGTKFYMLQVEDWTQSSPRRKGSPPKPNTTENTPNSVMAPAPDTFEPIVDPSSSHPKLEAPIPMSRHLLGPRQRTHSAPGPQASSLARLLAQGTPPIEEVAERTSPSPPRLSGSRPSSPLAQPPSPLARPSSPRALPSSPLASTPSHMRHPSTLVSPPHSRPSSPLASPPPPHARSSSPLAIASHSRPSPPRTSPSHAQAPFPLPNPLYMRPESPLAGPSRPQPPSPLAVPFTGSSPVQPSPKSASPLNPASRRSSSSSRPSTSSIFSPGRHPFTLSSSTSSAKAAPTTALTDPSASVPVSGLLSRSREGLPMREPVTPSPEGSPSEGMSSILLARRRTTSASMYGHNGSSPLSASAGNRPHPSQSQTHSQGALANLANSWGFGRKKGGSARHSIGGETAVFSHGDESISNSLSSTRTQRPAASEILRRYDDILPQERGSR